MVLEYKYLIYNYLLLWHIFCFSKFKRYLNFDLYEKFCFCFTAFQDGFSQ